MTDNEIRIAVAANEREIRELTKEAALFISVLIVFNVFLVIWVLSSNHTIRNRIKALESISQKVKD